MIDWIWNILVHFHEWALASYGKNTIHWVGGIAALVGIIVSLFNHGVYGVHRKLNFLGSFFPFAVLPLAIGLCDFKLFSTIGSFEQDIVKWIVIWMIVSLCYRIIELCIAAYYGDWLVFVLNLMSVVLILGGAVLFADIMGQMLLGVLILLGLASGGGAKFSSGGGKSDPTGPPDYTGNCGDEVFHNGRMWHHNGDWGDPWKPA